MPNRVAFTIVAGESDHGKRLDVVVAASVTQCSRSLASNLISNGVIRAGGELKKPKYRVKTGDRIEGCLPPPEPLTFLPQPMALDILFEDRDLIVVNKQPGLVVHPAPGHASGTLVNGLLHHCPALEGINGKLRPGIVHRLDKDTSGALVVAKTARALLHLSCQFKSRQVMKAYMALVRGAPDGNVGTIALPIGRHPTDRKRMSTFSRKGRAAETRWTVKERYAGITLLEIELLTGRTHQIRVHCAQMGHPVVGDPVYGRGRKGPNRLPNNPLAPLLQPIDRQMLHAWRLGFIHPVSGQQVHFEAALPADMANLLSAVRSLAA